MTVSIIRRIYAGTLTDVYGDPETPMETVEEIPDALVAPTTTADLADASRRGNVERLDVFLAAEVDVQAQDRFRIDGVDYDIDGHPSRWKGMSGWEAGRVVHVYRVEG